MKRSMLILAATMAMGTAAVAQDTMTQPTTPPTGATMPDQSGTMAQPGTTTPTDQGMTPPDASGAQTATPPGSTPGGSMQSDPAMGGMQGGAMPGTSATSGGAMQSSGAMASAGTTDTSNYPRCSRTVTDKCVQGAAMKRTASRRHR